MNFRKDVTVVSVIYWYQRLGLLKHQFKKFDECGRPDKHILWLNSEFPEVLSLCNEYADSHPGTYIVQSGNIYDLPAYDLAADLVETPFMLEMSQDICVTRPGWMEEFEAIAPFDMAGVEGEDGRFLSQTFDGYSTFHVRSGMTLINVDTFKKVGKYLEVPPAPGLSPTNAPWPAFEVGLTVKMAKAGYTVKNMEKYPLWDYDGWGDRILEGIKECSDEQIDQFDVAVHMERCPPIGLVARHDTGLTHLIGYIDGDPYVHITTPFNMDGTWDWNPVCGVSSLITRGVAGTHEQLSICNNCVAILN